MLWGARSGAIQAGRIREGFLEEGVSESRLEGQMGVSQAEMGACFRGRGHVCMTQQQEGTWQVPFDRI